VPNRAIAELVFEIDSLALFMELEKPINELAESMLEPGRPVGRCLLLDEDTSVDASSNSMKAKALFLESPRACN
jgi:hypothetical protein